MGRPRVYEPGQPPTLHPGESMVAELPSVEAMVDLMEQAKFVPLRWHVYPTPTWAGWWKRLRFRVLWWLPTRRQPELDISVHQYPTDTVH